MSKPTDFDYRKAALDAVIAWSVDEPTTDHVISKAARFEAYLRNGREATK